MTLLELQERYNQLALQELEIPLKVDEVLKGLDPYKEDIARISAEAINMDLAISDKPPQVFTKVCGSVFLGMGKTCQEVPTPNPDIAREMTMRNDLIRGRNSIIEAIDSRLKTVVGLTQQQVDIEKEQIDIRGQIIDMQKRITLEPVNILSTLGRNIKALFYKEEFVEAVEATTDEAPPVTTTSKIKEYLPYIAIAVGILVIPKLLKKKGGVK